MKAETKWADLDGFTALVAAAMWGHDGCVERLLQAGVERQAKVKLLFDSIDTDRSGAAGGGSP